MLASFDKNTGACIGLDFIQGNNGNGYADRGTALTIDANGDVLVGGEFKHTLYYANGSSVLNPNPGNPDFFIAKYATEPCPPLSVEEVEKKETGVWPNPVKDKLYADVKEDTNFKLYALDGRLVKVGKLSKTQHNIDMAGFSEGVYLLELKAKSGKTKTIKVVKE